MMQVSYQMSKLEPNAVLSYKSEPAWQGTPDQRLPMAKPGSPHYGSHRLLWDHLGKAWLQFSYTS